MTNLIQQTGVVGIENFFQAHPWLVAIILLWVLPWKGIALWKSAHKNQKIWFIAMLIVNTLAILEILYIFVFSKPREAKKSDDQNQPLF